MSLDETPICQCPVVEDIERAWVYGFEIGDIVHLDDCAYHDPESCRICLFDRRGFFYREGNA